MISWAIAVALIAAQLGAAEAAGMTTLPFTYVTATAANAMDDAALISAVQAAPPNVLHLGHVLPLNSVFGPTEDCSGFKPKLVPAEQLLARRASSISTATGFGTIYGMVHTR